MAINKYNKYNVWRRYKSYDSGSTWVAMDDYEAYQTEENAESCGYIPVTYRWVAVDGTMCNTDTHTLYSRTRQQASYDRGQTWDWTEPAVYNYGDVIEENSPQCGYPIYQWVTVEGATMCGTNEATKYNQYGVEKEQVSTDNGISWTDTGKQREGKMIENLSLKCGYVPEWKWEFTSISCGYKVPSNAQSALTRVVESTDYCEKGNKYNRSRVELSTDDGASWSKVNGDYQITLLQSATTECGYAEQWVTVDGEYVCGDGDSRYTKYHKEKKQVSYDSGATWNDTDETMKGDIIEAASTDCGFDNSVTVVAYTDGTYKYFDVEGTLTKSKLNSSNTIKKVIAGSKVTSIGENAFMDCTSLESVELSDSVTSINNQAFWGCSGLTNVVIPASVATIGDKAFIFCKNLTGVTLPNGLTSISDSVFMGCSSLENVVIPDSVASIGVSAFRDCSSIESVTIPTGVTSIGGYAFDGCSSLQFLTVDATTPPSLGDSAIPTTISTIYAPASSVVAYKAANKWKDYADKIQAIGTIPTPTMKVTYVDGSEKTFYNLKKIVSTTDKNKANAKEVVLYDGVTEIGNAAFSACTNLTGITISDTVTTIGYNAFASCTNLTGITIPDSVTSINTSVFNNCANLKNVKISDGVKTIRQGTFSSCPSLVNVVLPNRLETIENEGFRGCSSLVSITLPDTVKSIGWYAFNGCTSLSDITVKATTPPSLYDGTALPGTISVIYVPASSVNTYKSANVWSNYADKIFAIGTKLSMKITYKDGSNKTFYNLTSIESKTVSNKSDVKKVEIYDGVTTIGNEAFGYFCKSLTSVILPDSLTSIGRSAFWGCSGLTNVVIPDSVTSINNQAFGGCTSLTAATIGNSVTSIGDSAFYDCEKLTVITIPASVTNIGEAAFEYCRGLTAATIGNSVTSIGNRAFFDCALTSITIPASVTNIGEYAFGYCRGLETINYNDTMLQYKVITKGENWHSEVPASYVTCTDGQINIDI